MAVTITHDQLQDLIPPPNYNNHKGQMGRICVIGGSLQYTGAAYYAAMSCLLAGADLVYMVCCRGAVPILKTYSPELIVLPHCLDENDSAQHIAPWLGRMHAILIGPGLGTDPLVQSNVIRIIHHLTTANASIPLLLDADGLRLLVDKPALLSYYAGPVYLTPNRREFELLFPSGQGEIEKTDTSHIGRHVTLVVKGQQDIIVTPNQSSVCQEPNSWRRCGGQGDLVAGTLATMAHYAALKEKSVEMAKLTEEFKEHKATSGSNQNLSTQPKHNVTNWGLVAGVAACTVVRRSNQLAFQAKGRSMLATDMISQLSNALKQVFKHW